MGKQILSKLSDNTDLRRSGKYVPLSNLSITIHGKI